MKLKLFKTINGRAPMSASDDFKISKDNGKESCLVNIYPDIEYQKIEGFGGAFTEAATTLDKLSKKPRVYNEAIF